MYYLYGISDSSYILLLIGLALCILAQVKVKTTFSKYQKVRAKSGLTGQTAAAAILRSQGIRNVRISHISGNLTDNYNPKNETLNLSDSTMDSPSIAAIGVAAHECGHAIQHAKGYAPLVLRSTLVPAAQFGQTIAWPLILLGFLINSRVSNLLLMVGIIAFAAGVLFALVTLPVEFNASRRAVAVLRENAMMDEAELKGVKRVLTAAALTYVASAVSAILNLLRLILLARGRRSS